MEFHLKIDPSLPEAIIAEVHQQSELTDEIEALVMQYTGADKITGYAQEERTVISFRDIECVFVENGKTYAVTKEGRYRLKLRLYEAEQLLPSSFLRLNKSALGNPAWMKAFTSSLTGAIDVTFQCGHREYVSRRCFPTIKRRILL